MIVTLVFKSGKVLWGKLDQAQEMPNGTKENVQGYLICVTVGNVTVKILGA